MEWADTKIGFAFIPYQNQWTGLHGNNQQGLFKPGIKTREIGKVCEMLAIGVDDRVRKLARFHSQSQRTEPGLELGGRRGKRTSSHTKLRPIDLD